MRPSRGGYCAHTVAVIPYMKLETAALIQLLNTLHSTGTGIDTGTDTLVYHSFTSYERAY